MPLEFAAHLEFWVPGLFWAASTSCTAAVLCTIGGMYGVAQHRWPRLFVAVSLWFISLSYWLELLDVHIGNEMRRGAAFVLWPALAFTAWSGIKYSRAVVEEASKLLDDVG